ncbi:MAG: TonB-dependent receptor [Opitutales bacterium]|nr:TonB-dependent receptor [Opitutales bacterium]
MHNTNLWLALIAGILTLPSFAFAENAEVYSLSQEDIDQFNVSSIQELLNRVPGISASDSYVKIRGSSAVKVLVDGKPINNPLSSHSAIRWGFAPFSAIEQIDIYRGASAAMFGEGTDGGAIVIHRKKGTNSHGSILFEGGNYGSLKVAGGNNVSINFHNLHGSFEEYQANGFRENGDSLRFSSSISDQISVCDDNSVSLSLDYSWEEKGSPGYPDYPRLYARDASEAFTSSVYFKREHSIKSNLFFRSFWTKSVDPERELRNEMESWSMGNSTDFRIPFPGKASIPVGVSFESSHVKGTDLSPKHENEAAIFGNWMMRLTVPHPLYLSINGRFNWYSAFEDVLDPSTRLSFNPEKWKLFVSVGKGHVAPSILKRYQNTSTRIANPDLGMERTDKFEFGLSHGFSEALNLQTSLYSKQTSERITYVRIDDGMAQYRNIGEASWLGVETTLSGALSKTLRYSATHSWMKARDDSNDLVLSASPEHRIQTELEWLPVGAMSVTLSCNNYSTQFSRSDNTERVPSYFVVNLKIEYQWKNSRCYLRVENLLDHDYLYGDGLPGSPTEFTIGLKRSF